MIAWIQRNAAAFSSTTTTSRLQLLSCSSRAAVTTLVVANSRPLASRRIKNIGQMYSQNKCSLSVSRWKDANLPRRHYVSVAAAATNNDEHDNSDEEDNTNTATNNNNSTSSATTRTRRQSPPPTLDTFDYDEEFGGYSYQPDEYDAMDMQSQDLWDYDDNGMLVAKDTQPSPIATAAAAPAAEGSPSMHDEVAASQDESTLLLTTIETVASQQQSGVETSADMAPPPSPPAPLESPVEQPIASNNQQPSYAKDDEFFKKASFGMGISTDLDHMEHQLAQIKQSLRHETNNDKFNPNSPKQVSEALYGQAGESTSKDVLDAMAASGNKLADLMLQFRHLAQQIAKWKRRQESQEKGKYTRNVSTMERLVPKTDSATAVASGTAAVTATDILQEQKSITPQVEWRVEAEDPLLLVDASAYIFRAYYAYPPLHRSDGTPIGAVLGFCNMLNRLVLNNMMKGEQPRIALVFDAKGKTFRHDIYEEYKANRPPAPVDLVPQFGLIREVAKAYGIPQIEAPNFEADDVIATLATMALKEGLDANVLSGDKDLMQLVTPTDKTPSVQMIDPVTMFRVSYEDVIEKWGVSPELLGDVLALAGDSSDNIPGVPGIGPKTAATLLETYGSLEGLLENLDSIKQKGRREKLQSNIEQARLSRVLVELERNVPMKEMTFPDGLDRVSDLRMDVMDSDNLLQFYEEMGLRDLKRRFESRLQTERGINGVPTATRRSKFTPRVKAAIPKPEDFMDVPF